MNVSIELGREYVEAYVLFVHYVEEIHLAAAKPLAHGQQSGGEAQHGETEIQKHKH